METTPLENSNLEKQNSDAKVHVCDSAIDTSTRSAPFPISVDLLQYGENKETINLEEFEKKQKLIEEQNRLKKQMLAKELAMRFVNNFVNKFVSILFLIQFKHFNLN